MIRVCELADVPWMLEVATAAYEPGKFEPGPCAVWLRQLIADPHRLCLRGQKAVVIAAVAPVPYAPSRRIASFLPVMSTGDAARELVEMTALALKWAKERGAKEFVFSAETGTDMGPLARRFGGVGRSPVYVVTL